MFMSIFVSFKLDSMVLDGKDIDLYFSVSVVAWTSSVLMLEEINSAQEERRILFVPSLKSMIWGPKQRGGGSKIIIHGSA